ncbi:hypothetical protein CPB85DRAFT_1307638, partial [Mucidula mucida]
MVHNRIYPLMNGFGDEGEVVGDRVIRPCSGFHQEPNHIQRQIRGMCHLCKGRNVKLEAR